MKGEGAMSRYVWLLAIFSELFELMSVGFSKLAFLPCLSLSTVQTVEREIALTAFGSAKNSRKHQKTTPGKVLNSTEAL